MISLCQGIYVEGVRDTLVQRMETGNMEEKRTKLDRDGFLVIEVAKDDCCLFCLDVFHF